MPIIIKKSFNTVCRVNRVNKHNRKNRKIKQTPGISKLKIIKSQAGTNINRKRDTIINK